MDISKKLAEPFEKVHWRVGSTNAKKLGCKPWEATKGLPLCYIDARDVMDRLDAVVGPQGWQDEYTETPSGRVICSLSVVLPVGERTTDWITKSDGAGDTGTEGEKGAISDAFKRAAVKFGIGRYLYDVKAGWVDLQNGKLPRDFNGAQFLPATRPPADPEPPKVISKKQAADLEAKITEVGADYDHFLEYLRIGKLEDLAAHNYDRAIQALEAKKS